MKLVRDVIKNEDKFVLEINDEIVHHNETFMVKDIVKNYNARYIIMQNKQGNLFVLDDKAVQSIMK